MTRAIFTAFLAIPAALAQGPVMQAVLPQYVAVKTNFVEAAEVMPEADYAFRLSPAQRTYAEWIDHTAGMNVRMCASMKGETAPAPNTGDKSKTALVSALKASFDYCDATLHGMTDEAATREVSMGTRKVSPVAVMVSQIAQLNAHYGNMVGYLRSKNITPPSTARSQKK